MTAKHGLEHVGDALRSGWGTLLKPLAWQGDMCFGPNRGSRVTFMRPEDADSDAYSLSVLLPILGNGARLRCRAST